MATALDAIQNTISSALEAAGPSVVGIGHQRAHGSGLVVGEGRVLTNAHNLSRHGVDVVFADGRRETASVLGLDVDGDVAVLGVDTGDAPVLAWSPNGVPTVGQPVVALANPGGRGPRATIGYVSGVDRSFRGPRGRRIAGSYEHTAPLLPGSSGGPLLTADGDLLGVNTHRIGEGFYLAIPADDDLHRRVEALAAGEEATRPRLGVGLAPAEVGRQLRRAVGLDEVDGLLVRSVEEASPAAAGGIREGDLLVAVGGRPVPTVDDLHAILESASGELEVQLLRGADEVTLTVAI